MAAIYQAAYIISWNDKWKQLIESNAYSDHVAGTLQRWRDEYRSVACYVRKQPKYYQLIKSNLEISLAR